MNPLTNRLRRQALDEHFARLVAKALMESEPSARTYVMGTGGDHLRLRGIPTICRGVGGAIIGTNPEREACK